MDIVLKLVDCTRSKHNLTLLYQYNEIIFTTTLWYSTVDFHHSTHSKNNNHKSDYATRSLGIARLNYLSK